MVLRQGDSTAEEGSFDHHLDGARVDEGYLPLGTELERQDATSGSPGHLPASLA